MITAFNINIDPDVIKDLKSRLAGTRWTDEIENDKWEYGTNKDYLKELCAYWQHEFDWKKQETYLNSFPQFKTQIDGFELHFIHMKGKGKNPIPLLLTHGWPDSIARFLKLIPLLINEDENGISFDVIAPSIPGHGFSQIPGREGMNNKKIASLFASLMTDELGYDKFLAHGGDAGSEITEQIALYHRKNLLGIHLTDVPYHHIIVAKDETLTEKEKKYKAEISKWQQTEGAYNMIQSTRPQTLSYGLNDSPAGLAGWIVEKFHNWSDCNGNIESCFSKDELLTNITIYWVTQTINSSFRRYNETMKDMMQEMFNPLQKINPLDKTGNKIEVPTGISEFQIDKLPPEEFASQFFNILHWGKLPRGGHFAAWEQPELLAGELRKFAQMII